MAIQKMLAWTVLAAYVAGTPLYAQEADNTAGYIELNSGEEAPYDGYLFHSDTLAEIITKHDKEKDELTLFCDSEKKRLQLELGTEIKKLQAELKINTDQYEDLLKLNKAELDRLGKEAKYNSWLTSGSFIAGVVVGGLIIASTIKLTLTIAK
jgi:hypothetical protein